MYGIDKLLAAGLPDNVAYETAFWFAHYGNDSDFDRYICELQNGQRARVCDS